MLTGPDVYIYITGPAVENTCRNHYQSSVISITTFTLMCVLLINSTSVHRGNMIDNAFLMT